ncbi:MAG: hemerythrin domain-containing protein [Acidobacteriota bacterium]
MMPVGSLMIEHRLIERIINVFKKQLQNANTTPAPDFGFIDEVVDFIRTYADRCHHGKEEDILFKSLEQKPLTSEQKLILDELLDEHKWARQATGQIVEAKKRFLNGDQTALHEIVSVGLELAEFYPKHIEKEDKHFFIPVMNYFSKNEQEAMLSEFQVFDAELIHEKYRGVVLYSEIAD